VKVLAATSVSVSDGWEKTFFGLSFSINDIWAAFLAFLVVGTFGFLVARKATSGVPSRAQLIWEVVVGAVQDQVESMIGPAGRPIVPVAITLFVFILCCNWFELFFWTGHTTALLPTPTSNVNIDYAMAIFVIGMAQITGLRRAGPLKYIRHYTNPLNLVELISNFLSLALRLFGNVFAGALSFALLAGLFKTLLPAVFVGDILWLPFDLVIFLIQAFIFSLLSIVYYQQAVAIASGGH
jgi:F-type H+-transporting ATPase subunit a